MKALTLVLTIVLALAFAGAVVAVPPGKTVEYAGGGFGKVVFDGKAHMDAGLKCNDCHTSIFEMKKGAVQLTMAAMNEGKFCGACHNGTKAFSTKDAATCARCHEK